MDAIALDTYEDDDSEPVTTSMFVPLGEAEQRTHPRYELCLAITMSGDNNFYVGLSENISEGGIFIATHRHLPIGTQLVLTFFLPNATEQLSVRGAVQWLRGPEATEADDDELSAVKTGMGVQFDELDHRASAVIRAFIQSRRPDFFDG